MSVDESEIQEQAEIEALHGDDGAGTPVVATPHPIEERLEQLAELREQARTPGSEKSVACQHERGKLTARERLEEAARPRHVRRARHARPPPRADGFGIENTMPARMVSVYAPDVTPPDFHAVAEVYVGGEWRLVDATGMAEPDTMVRIGVGRDAADVAFHVR